MPDLIITNANIITLNDAQPRASAMAIRDGKILAVGSDHEVTALAHHKTQKLNAQKKTITPGFCDSHVHFLAMGHQLLTQADLVGSQSITDILDRLSAQARKTTGWLIGHGFDQSKLKETRFPTREELDTVSRNRPILISRICGHAAVVNSAALATLSNAEAAAGDPLSGLYTETTIDAFYSKMPPMTDKQMQDAIVVAGDVALRTGITSVHTLLDTPDQMRGYVQLHRQHKLPVRVTAIPPYSAVAQLHDLGISTGFGDHWLKFGAAKFFSDGSLGAHTAWLSLPYSDNPKTRGIRIYDPHDLKQKCRDAQQKGFQLAIHAIGDEALREVLDAIEYALNGENNEIHRHRVEHASLCPPDCLNRMAKLKIIATLQPQFVTSDTWTSDRIGKHRLTWAYPFKSMIAAGVPVTLSSDSPVEKMDALAAIAAAVGRHEWSPDERLTPELAIRAYCQGSAYAGFAEHYSGSLETGKLADFVILSDDPTTLPAKKISELRAEKVFIDGRQVR